MCCRNQPIKSKIVLYSLLQLCLWLVTLHQRKWHYHQVPAGCKNLSACLMYLYVMWLHTYIHINGSKTTCDTINITLRTSPYFHFNSHLKRGTSVVKVVVVWCVSRHLKEELAWAINKLLQVISNIMLFSRFNLKQYCLCCYVADSNVFQLFRVEPCSFLFS